eukprot:SM000346S12846  [mRNA]  locus=s346:867:1969:+ [translate_table: standard]
MADAAPMAVSAPLVALASLALALALALAPLPAAAQRYIIVGADQDPDEPWTNVGANYTHVQVPILHYVVWTLTSRYNWENCIYNGAVLTGNVTAGEGAGLWVTVTAEPQYIADGNFFCEEGAKVILNGSLGPLPKQLQDMPVPASIYVFGRVPPPGPTFKNQTGSTPYSTALTPPSVPDLSPPLSSASLFQASVLLVACAAVSLLTML